MDVVTPSCRVFVVLDDSEFRRSLIKALDQHNFSVTFSDDGTAAVQALEESGEFRVVIVGVDVEKKVGVSALDFLQKHREKSKCGIIIIGEPNPAVRTFAPWVDETLLKPVDPQYVATRARAYCDC
jgi:DNA-binding NtrC family response regulator